MKKCFLVLSTLLMSVIPACAVDWQVVETTIPNFNLYIDMDSVKPIKDKEYVYAIKYNFTGKPEKVAYIKSDFYENYIGIIQAGDFETDSYRPMAVLDNPHVFMKPIKDDSFLMFTHKYVADLAPAPGVKIAEDNSAVSETGVLPAVSKSKKQKSNIEPAAYKENTPKPQKELASSNMKEYVASVCKELDNNWTPPASGRKTQAILIVTIGSDGSLYEYHFAKSSGDEATDRSIVSAVKQTVPFPKFGSMNKNVKNFNFQFVFNYGIFKKSVI